jgi:RNA polymerase sigma factor (sigma-70 family)
MSNAPDLSALRRGDADAWDAAFEWLWPGAFAVAQLKLQPYLPGDVEDVAIEALEALVDKVGGARSVEELKPLVAGIVHNRAVSRLREHFAAKRGAGKTESLDAPMEEGGSRPEAVMVDSPLDALADRELAQRLQESLATLKPPQGDILADFYLHGMRYEEIAEKRGVAVGSVGVYLKRGLETLRRIWGGGEDRGNK